MKILLVTKENILFEDLFIGGVTALYLILKAGMETNPMMHLEVKGVQDCFPLMVSTRKKDMKLLINKNVSKLNSVTREII